MAIFLLSFLKLNTQCVPCQLSLLCSPSGTILDADKVTELDAFSADATSPPFPGFALGLMIHWRWRNEPDKNRLKTSAIIAVIFSVLLINLLLNNR
jgi:hypothetical protein